MTDGPLPQELLGPKIALKYDPYLTSLIEMKNNTKIIKPEKAKLFANLYDWEGEDRF